MNYKGHKYDNTVIEVLTSEHGKQVINWWNDQGVDADTYYGNNNKADNDIMRYYGLIDGIFRNHTVQECIDDHIKIIILPMEEKRNTAVLQELESELSKCTQAREYLNTVEFLEALDFNNVLMYLKGREDALRIAINKLN